MCLVEGVSTMVLAGGRGDIQMCAATTAITDAVKACSESSMPPGRRGSTSAVLQTQAYSTVICTSTIREVTCVSGCGLLYILYIQSVIILVPGHGLNSTLPLGMVSGGRYLTDMSVSSTCECVCVSTDGFV